MSSRLSWFSSGDEGHLFDSTGVPPIVGMTVYLSDEIKHYATRKYKVSSVSVSMMLHHVGFDQVRDKISETASPEVRFRQIMDETEKLDGGRWEVVGFNFGARASKVLSMHYEIVMDPDE